MIRMDPVYADMVEESAVLLLHYGAYIGALGDSLVTTGVPVTAVLEEWGTERNVPADRVPVAMVPVLVSIDGVWMLALSWDFGESRLYLLTHGGTHVVALAPSSAVGIALVGTEVAWP
ncbi:hypothetical protein SAMN05216410_1486 [Sanguibacter gelidistatuariae]|uniref:Uncharacterized protein n=2 Tax=Sanguibacter gelidistatuariae TaxID=1814289 RepID=A0A1G6K2X4_9MICO|nr:hypothetical protein SAMN05216410_1486 [Sanguibacter gelidistatuariae]